MRSVASCLVLILVLAGPAAAASLQIVSPQNEETVHDNTGRVPVRVQGKVPEGARLRVLLDGRPFGEAQRTDAFTLEGVERGQHELRVVLLDASGRELEASQPVVFYQWQASARFPNRRK